MSLYKALAYGKKYMEIQRNESSGVGFGKDGGGGGGKVLLLKYPAILRGKRSKAREGEGLVEKIKGKNVLGSA